MYRYAIEKLKEWKDNPNKKPLILNGARQVGKTWLMLELGKSYKDCIYINFDNNPEMEEIFGKDLRPNIIIQKLQAHFQKRITNETLLIFDEIGEMPRALTSLKYFNEEMPQLNIICAGSLLGISIHKGVGIPVGKVSYLNIYPLNFSEFLLATGREILLENIQNHNWEIISSVKQTYETALKEYYFVGGMPACVQSFADNNDFFTVREIQEDILKSYDQDFTKHTNLNLTERIREVWRSIPSQLAKENKKFVYGVIREGARAKEYELALNWLQDSGLIYEINRVTQPDVPLEAYKEIRNFKIFICDVGLLCAKCKIELKDIFSKNKLLMTYKGAISEQFVCEEFVQQKMDFAYYTNDRNTSEVDFIAKISEGIVPIEVKAEINLQAKSLKMYMEKFKPELACRLSLADYKVTNNLYNIPLYAVSEIKEILK